jgi:hypothetical protein
MVDEVNKLITDKIDELKLTDFSKQYAKFKSLHNAEYKYELYNYRYLYIFHNRNNITLISVKTIYKLVRNESVYVFDIYKELREDKINNILND